MYMTMANSCISQETQKPAQNRLSKSPRREKNLACPFIVPLGVGKSNTAKKQSHYDFRGLSLFVFLFMQP